MFAGKEQACLLESTKQPCCLLTDLQPGLNSAQRGGKVQRTAFLGTNRQTGLITDE